VLTRSQSGKTDLDITLRLDLLNNSKQITGVISNMSASDPWTAPLTNDLAGLYLNLNGSYTVAFSPDSPPLTSPVGFSVLTITNNPTGTMRVLNGRLADGAPFTFSVPISRLGYAPVSTRLYRDSSGNYHGLLHGNLHFSGIAGPVTGKLNWIRSTSPTALPALYSAGFTNTDMNVIGSYYAPPAPGNGALNVGNGTILAGPCDIGLQSAYNWIVAINGNNTLTRTAGDSGFKSCTIQPAVGLCTLRFRPIGISTDIVGTGVIIQNNGIILGFFPGLHQAGEFVLSRSP
jgi:hypothetical protein